MQKYIVSILLLSSLFSGVSIIPEISSTQQAKFKFEHNNLSELTAQKEPKDIVPGKGRRSEENQEAKSRNTQLINEFV
ncbi:MAG: hypothetical protein WBA93_00665 [Microcoleaceae cyanobacterium]